MDIDKVLVELFRHFDVDQREALTFHQLRAAVVGGLELQLDTEELLEMFGFPEDEREAARHRVSFELFERVVGDLVDAEEGMLEDDAFFSISQGKPWIEEADLVAASKRVDQEENAVMPQEAREMVEFFASEGAHVIHQDVFTEIMEFQ